MQKARATVDGAGILRVERKIDWITGYWGIRSCALLALSLSRCTTYTDHYLYRHVSLALVRLRPLRRFASYTGHWNTYASVSCICAPASNSRGAHHRGSTLYALHRVRILQFLRVDLDLITRPNTHRRLPHHHDIVLRRARGGPILALSRCPAEVRRARSVSAVHEQQLGRAVLLVVWRLLNADLREIPDVDAPVARGGREDRRVVWRPGDV